MIRLLDLLLQRAAGLAMLSHAAGLLRAAYSQQRTDRGRAICHFSTAETVEGREYEQFGAGRECPEMCAALAGDEQTTTHQ